MKPWLIIGLASCLSCCCTTLSGPNGLPVAKLDDFKADLQQDDACFIGPNPVNVEEAKARCEELAERQYFRGMWEVDSDGGTFSFLGQPGCTESIDKRNCVRLVGDDLVYPPEDACVRAYEMEFIGRRYLHPIGHTHLPLPIYGVKVEKVLSKARRRNPVYFRRDCVA